MRDIYYSSTITAMNNVGTHLSLSTKAAKFSNFLLSNTFANATRQEIVSSEDGKCANRDAAADEVVDRDVDVDGDDWLTTEDEAVEELPDDAGRLLGRESSVVGRLRFFLGAKKEVIMV